MVVHAYASRERMQEDCKFKTSLDYLMQLTLMRSNTHMQRAGLAWVIVADSGRCPTRFMRPI